MQPLASKRTCHSFHRGAEHVHADAGEKREYAKRSYEGLNLDSSAACATIQMTATTAMKNVDRAAWVVLGL